MLESEKRYFPNGGNGLQFRNGYAIDYSKAGLPTPVQSNKKPARSMGDTLRADRVLMAIVQRERTNKLMGF